MRHRAVRHAAAVRAIDVLLPAGTGGEPGSRRRAPSSGVTRSGGLLAALTVVGCLVFAPSAVAFKQVPGSPFATGQGPWSVAFSPGGGLLAAANQAEAGTVSVFSVNQTSGALAQVAGSPFATGANPQSVAFSPGGALLATANYGDGVGTVSVFSVNQTSGALTQVPGSPFAGTVDRPTSVAFSPGGGLLATANRFGDLATGDGAVSVFSVDQTSGALIPVPGSPFATGIEPQSVAFSPGGTLLATPNEYNDSVSVFSVDQTLGALTPVPGSPFATGLEPASVAFSPRGGLLATANATGSANHGTVSVFSVDQTSGALTPVPGSPFATGSQPGSVAFSPGGGLLATANSNDNTVSVFSVDQATGALTQVSGSPFATGGIPSSVAFSPGGRLLATANEDGTISVFFTGSTGGAAGPVTKAPPKVSGSAKTGGTLRCSSGSWTVRPTRVVYRWVR